MFESLDAAFRLYLSRLPRAALIVLTVWLPVNLIYSYFELTVLGPDQLRLTLLVGFALMVILDTLTTGALFHLFGETLLGRPCGYGDAMAMGISRWGLLIATRVVIQVLASIGLFLLILPGLILLARWALAEVVVAREGLVPSEARRRSVELTEGRRVEIFLAWHLPLMAFFGLSWWGEQVLARWLGGSWLLSGLYDSFWMLAQAYIAAVLVTYYTVLGSAEGEA